MQRYKKNGRVREGGGRWFFLSCGGKHLTHVQSSDGVGKASPYIVQTHYQGPCVVPTRSLSMY